MIGNKFQEIIDDISASEIATKFESNLPGTDKKKLKHVTNWITDKSWLEILWVGLTNDLYGAVNFYFCLPPYISNSQSIRRSRKYKKRKTRGFHKKRFDIFSFSFQVGGIFPWVLAPQRFDCTFDTRFHKSEWQGNFVNNQIVMSVPRRCFLDGDFVSVETFRESCKFCVTSIFRLGSYCLKVYLTIKLDGDLIWWLKRENSCG